MEVDGILGDEALEKRAQDVALGDAGDEVGIELGDLVSDSPVQDLIPVALLDGGFALEAAAGGQQPESQNKRKEAAHAARVWR